MVEDNQDFASLMRRVQTGSDGATRDLIDRYGHHILHVIRRRLSRRLRTRFDSGDFEQAVWASFFTGVPKDRTFASPDDLIAYLLAMTHHKVADAYRQQGQKQESEMLPLRPLEVVLGNQSLAEPAARTPTPSQVFIAEEQWDRISRDLPQGSRQILKMLRAGHSHEEIAQHLGINRRTVRRLLHLLNHRVTER